VRIKQTIAFVGAGRSLNVRSIKTWAARRNRERSRPQDPSFPQLPRQSLCSSGARPTCSGPHLTTRTSTPTLASFLSSLPLPSSFIPHLLLGVLRKARSLTVRSSCLHWSPLLQHPFVFQAFVLGWQRKCPWAHRLVFVSLHHPIPPCMASIGTTTGIEIRSARVPASLTHQNSCVRCPAGT